MILEEIVDAWLPRKNQIHQVEAIVAYLLRRRLGVELMHKRVTGMVDYDAALGAMVKRLFKYC